MNAFDDALELLAVAAVWIVIGALVIALAITRLAWALFCAPMAIWQRVRG